MNLKELEQKLFLENHPLHAVLVEAMEDAARTLEGAHLGGGQEVAYVVAKSLRRAAQ